MYFRPFSNGGGGVRFEFCECSDPDLQKGIAVQHFVN
jgi:hypothetical protein